MSKYNFFTNGTPNGLIKPVPSNLIGPPNLRNNLSAIYHSFRFKVTPDANGFVELTPIQRTGITCDFYIDFHVNGVINPNGVLYLQWFGGFCYYLENITANPMPFDYSQLLYFNDVPEQPNYMGNPFMWEVSPSVLADCCGTIHTYIIPIK